MNELSKTVPPAKPGAAPVAATPVQPAAVAAAAGQSVPRFGGHRGGGKKRLDGLPAGSAAAIAVDKEKDRLRKNLANAAKRGTPLPPPLPGVAAPSANAAAPLAGDSNAVPGVVAAVAGVAGAAPLFVPWGQKLLEKPARLLTKIADRLRVWSLMKHIRKIGLTPEEEKEIEAELKYKDEVLADFNAALAEAATIELNKRNVAGAQHSHWVNLSMTGGELVLLHLQSLDRIEKLVLAKRDALQKEVVAAEAKASSKN